jgi:hypothetical protein
MTDVAGLLQEIAAAQDLVELAALEREAEELTARLTDAIRERREYLNRR